ncbi:MAG: shikimate dehydrogenase [Planctomycetota bacterium]|jgi:3-dehydroquinate dehydratase/shikimate dehydrogenase
MTYLAVPISGRGFDSALEQIRAAAPAGAEMLELRADYLEDLSVSAVGRLIAEAKSCFDGSVLVTCRDQRQGGAGGWDLDLRLDVLCGGLDAGADFVDLEYENFLLTEARDRILGSLSEHEGARLVLSAHDFDDFDGRFDDIGGLHKEIKTACPSAIPKLVYTAGHINDCFEGFDLLHGADGELAVFCMGEAGLISRVIAKKLGSFLTFACLDEQSGTAPGQLTIETFRDFYRSEQIDAQTDIFGVIGCPVAHSMSPAVFNATFDELKSNDVYLPVLIEGDWPEFERFMTNVLERPWLGFNGFSVTIPHKHNALEFVRKQGGYIEPLAERIGAANTIIIDPDAKVSAYNTDYAGALDAIATALNIKRIDLKNTSVAVIGAGGVSRAIVAGLRDVDAKVTIYNRTIERAEKLAGEFDCDFGPLAELENIKTKLVINCTSIGMHPKVDATPLPKHCITGDMAIFDTVYNPLETLLLKNAKEAGAKTIDGMTMFVNQALAQFKHFTGTNASAERMRKIMSSSLT